MTDPTILSELARIKALFQQPPVERVILGPEWPACTARVADVRRANEIREMGK